MRDFLHERYSSIAAGQRDRIAVRGPVAELTYGELDDLSDRLAEAIRAVGAPPGPVALRMSRCESVPVAILGTLKANRAYVPIDPGYPKSRQDYILSDCSTRLLLSDGDLREDESPLASLGPITLAERSGATPSPSTLPDDAAYVIYTSGSSGMPKGCVVTHTNVLALFDGAGPLFSFGPDDVWPLFHSLSFDFSVWELWGALLYGGCAVVVPGQATTDPRALVELLTRYRVTVLNQVPSVFGHLVQEIAQTRAHLPLLRYVIFGGEAIAPGDVTRWWDLAVAPDAALINMYGITETTVHVTHCRLTRQLLASAEPGLTPIGRALPHLEVSLRDERGRPTEPGQPGEIWVGGAGVCAGYLDRPTLSAQQFRSDGDGERERRYYRSGDWGVQTPDGDLYYAGRRDAQVKVGGFRIELGEVESALRALPGIYQAACLVERSSAGVDQIVAYVVPDTTVAGAVPMPGAQIRQRLGESLPAHLVPHRVRRLTRLPVTDNGKLDRAALSAAQEVPDQDGTRGRSPRSPREELLCELFAEVLNRPVVGIDEDFFERGGHSLMAIRLVNRIRTLLGVEMSIGDLFQCRTVAGLVDHLAVGSDRPPLRPRERPARVPLSYAQDRLWLLHQMHGENPAYHIPHALRLTGRLDVPALEAAIGDVVARHEALRTIFPDQAGRTYQRILSPEAAQPPLPVRQVSPDELDELITAVALEPFDLAEDLPLRVALFVLGPDQSVLVLVLHHIAGDGWSLGALSGDLSRAYQARLSGLAPAWKPLPVQYADYALWQREWLGEQGGPDSAAGRQLAFWTEVLHDLPEELDLPADRPRPAQASHRGGAVDIELDQRFHAELSGLARASGATLHMVLQAAVAGLLTRLGAGTDIPIGNAIAGRTDDALEPLVGFFVNTLVTRTDTSADPSFVELVRRVRERNVAAYAHQDLPFERLVEVLNPVRSAARHPLFQVMLATQNNAPVDFDLPGLTVEMTPVYHDTAKFDLSFKIDERRGPGGEPLGIAGAVEYNGDLFDRATVEVMVGCFTRFLAAVAAQPSLRLSRVDICEPGERDRIAAWNMTDAPFPASSTVATLVERQVDEAPDAVALVQHGVCWTYRQLDVRANQIAWVLLEANAGQGTRVAVHLPRGPELVAALLAVWKAGSAYLPLDPDYPPGRLEFMCRDSGVTALLTNDQLIGRLRLAEGVEVISVDSDRVRHASVTRPARSATGRDLAYVIYTSGSTGTPKSVMIEHGGVVNRLCDMIGRFKLTPEDVSLQLISVGFEPPVREIFAPLAAGGSVALLPPEGPRDPSVVVAAIREHRPTVICCIVPSLLEAVIATGAEPATFGSLRLVATGGEVLRAAEVAELLGSWGCEVVNQYGPTETTMMSSVHPVRPEDLKGRIPIGRPLANTRIFLLDRYLNQVPIGMPGEAYLAGVGLGRGYLGRPGLTAASFVANPFGAPGERMYRSGDLCRWRADGNLEFIGRVDDQVKVRGFRIEMGEIEAALRDQPGVAQAAAIVREDRPGDRRVVAYVTPANGRAPDPGELREALAGRLPDHMVPAGIVVLDTLPLRGNGKLNRDLLPVPDLTRLGAGTVSRLPRTPLEELLCELFAEVLGLPDPVGLDDDFFRLGGHSLLAARLIGQVRATLGIELTMGNFFQTPTVAGLARPTGLDSTEGALGVVLPLRPRGHRTPLFCVHPGGGLSWCYAGLMRHLDPGYPIWGVQAHGLLHPDDMPATLEDMADVYVQRIRSVWPEGPYRLLGWSFGGIVAHRVAARLQAQGGRVDLLAMLDCYPGVTDFYRADERDLFMSLLDPSRVAGIPGEGSPEIAEAVAILATDGGALSGLNQAQLVALLRTMAHNRRLVTGFTPDYVDGDILFFQARLDRAPGAPAPDVWRQYVSGTVAVHPIESRHMDMAQPVPLAEIGRVLAQALARLDEPARTSGPRSEEESA